MSNDEYDYDFERGDVFTTKDGLIQVRGVGQFGEYLTVTDPTAHHPQDDRSGRWTIERGLLEDDLDAGRVERAELVVGE